MIIGQQRWEIYGSLKACHLKSPEADNAVFILSQFGPVLFTSFDEGG